MEIKTLTVGEYQAAYREVGQGEAIVFLHGFLGDGSVWQPVMECLRDRYRCIALDLLGFGNSSKPKLKYVIDHQVNFLQQVVTAMGLASFHLVGYSYGGWTAAAYAIATARSRQALTLNPSPQGEGLQSGSVILLPREKGLGDEDNPSINTAAMLPRLKSLTLVAPAGIRDDSFVGRYNHLKPLLWQNPLVDGALALLAPVATLLGKSQIYNQAKRARQEFINQPVARSFLIDRLRPEDAIDTVEQKINIITVPTLVIAGGSDETIPLWHCQVYEDRVPHALLEILPTAGHDLVQTHSQTIAELIHKLIAPLPSRVC